MPVGYAEAMKNILSIDLESWAHFRADILKDKALATSLARKAWDDHYLPSALDQLLHLLDKYDQKATFFVVAEVFDWYPESIVEIQKRGHEVGFHTYDHPLLRNREIMDEQLRKSADFLRRFHPIGFRAPAIYITSDSLASLKEHGFIYSSSSYDDGPKRTIQGIEEIPVSALSWRPGHQGPPQLPQAFSLRLLSRMIPSSATGALLPSWGQESRISLIRSIEKDSPQSSSFIPGNSIGITRSGEDAWI
jgi:peptidoglycan/xylan/chitin deacetylase (PgdA/CDA1 family)